MTGPLSYEVAARIVRPGVSELQAKPVRIAFDSSPGMSDELPGPAELLCGAFAACLLGTSSASRDAPVRAVRRLGARLAGRSRLRRSSPTSATSFGSSPTNAPARRAPAAQPRQVRHGLQHSRRACDVTGTVVAISPAVLGGVAVLSGSGRVFAGLAGAHDRRRSVLVHSVGLADVDVDRGPASESARLNSWLGERPGDAAGPLLHVGAEVASMSSSAMMSEIAK